MSTSLIVNAANHFQTESSKAKLDGEMTLVLRQEWSCDHEGSTSSQTYALSWKYTLFETYTLAQTHAQSYTQYPIRRGHQCHNPHL
jgi:hypothetical protein